MALKADRHELDVDISFFYNSAAAERGGVVVLDTTGSGAAMDQAGAKVKYKTGAAGDVAVGVLLNDVVNLDLTRQHINWHQDEVQLGGKVSILKKGYVVTNMYDGTPTAGGLACVGDTTLGKVELCSDVSGSHKIVVGRFLSIPDEDSYVKLEVNLPAATDNAGTLE
jgi:hypothetical protein